MVDAKQGRERLSIAVDDKRELVKCAIMGESHRFLNPDFENDLEISPSPTSFEQIENETCLEVTP
jgi:hypothetical protein